MMPIRRLAPLITVIVLSVGALSGCGVVQTLMRSTDVARVPYSEAPVASAEPPDPGLADHPIVAQAARSVVKIHSVVHACQKILEGSGVVFLPGRVMTSAHVVAGADADGITVSVGDEERAAHVVSYDPSTDISVLDVPDLQAPALSIAEGTAPNGTDALILGYPGGGAFEATPARIREVIELNGPDIYRTTTVTREVYVIRGRVQQGDSGGPLIDVNGRVLGISFGAAVDNPDTSFALTGQRVFTEAVTVEGSTPVATGGCVS
jgi:S1-C subfamily serine protease